MVSRNKFEMCRLCLCENECFVNIFEMNDWQGYVAAEVISDLLQFQVSEADGYTHVVCLTCLTKLTDFRLFKECCQKSKVAYDDIIAVRESLEKQKTEMVEFVDVKEEPTYYSDNEGIDSEYAVGLACTRTISNNGESIFEESKGTSISEEVEALSSGEMVKSEEESIPSVERIYMAPLNQQDKERENETAREKGVGSSNGKFVCDHCKKVLMTKSGLVRHVKTHGFGKSYNCEEEEEEGKGTAPEKIIGGRKGKFECHCCRKVLTTKYTLKLHLASHGIGDFVKCDVCNKTCVSKWHLVRHTRRHTGERPYKCTHCSALFRYDSNLRLHMQIHARTNLLKCEKCNLSFSQSSDLKSHMRFHPDLKPYSCKVCHVDFCDKSHLTRHMRTHYGDRPYKCAVCPKAFSQSAHLKNHQVVHSGEKPYPCPQCNKRFSEKGSVKRHLKKVCVKKCQRAKEVLSM